jgi:uncharacterized protein YidB (DUF937 family)
MGLLDILNGMQNGPRGQRHAGGASGSSGGMSKLTMALVALLAYKALKSRGHHAGASEAGSAPPLTRAGSGNPSGSLSDILGGLFGGTRTAPAGAKPGTGGLADMLPGGLGGLLGGAAAGSLLTSGLGNLLKDLQQSGHGHVAHSWIGSGPNQDIAPDDLEKALGGDTFDTLTQYSGMSRDDLLTGLSQNLPDLIDQLTPHGRLPTEQEAAQIV